MLILEVKISRRVYRKIENIADYVTRQTSADNARKYGIALISEIMQLSIYGSSIKPSDSVTLRMVHPKAKSITTHNKKWRLVFHIEDSTVFIDDIIPASIIIN